MGAEKQFPSMLIAPGSFYIQIKFAKSEQAFQVTMDPCRRIFGTHRDYVPNVGLPTYYATEYWGKYLTTDRCSVSTFMAYTSHAAKGTDSAWKGLLELFPPKAASSLNSIKASDTNGYRNDIFANAYNYEKELATGGLVSSANTYCGTQGFNEGFSTGVAKPQYVPVDTPWKYDGNLFHFNSSAYYQTGPAPPTAANIITYVK